MTDDLEWTTAVDDPTRYEKPHRRHVWGVDVGPAQDEPGFHYVCLGCGRIKDEAASRRGRNNKKRGQRIQKARIEALGGENLLGNKPNHDGRGLAFSYESKSGAAYPKQLDRWLRGIPVTAGQTPVLIVTETPGPGRRAKAIVVVDFDDWKLLHFEVRP